LSGLDLITQMPYTPQRLIAAPRVPRYVIRDW
jgi:hypothetical protein